MPGTLPSSTVYEHPVISFDIPQTALALAGAADEKNADAVNLLPYVLGENDAPPHEAIYWRTGQDAKRAVRRGKDKLVLWNRATMLFDLDADLEESIDIADANKKTVTALTEMFDKWNADNQPAIFPGYRQYHELLKEFHAQVGQDAQANDKAAVR